MNVSITKFCKERGLAKTSVYNRCKELGIDTANGLSESAVSQLEAEFNVQPATPTIPGIPVEVGNHAITLSAPTLPQTYSLESLRDGEAVSFEDPLAVAAQFLQVADGLTEAMQSDIQARQQRLKQTQQAKDAIAQKRQQLDLEARLYQLQTQQLDGQLSEETAELQAQLDELKRLGKQPQSSQSA